MGKRKQYDDLVRQMMAQFQTAQQPTQYDNQYNAEWKNIGDWLNNRDYRANMPDGMNINLMPLVEAQKMRKMVRGTYSGQQGARGSNMSNILNAQKEMDDNMFAQDWGNAFEQKVGELGGRRDALGNMLMSSQNNRNQIGIQGSQSALQAFNGRPRSMCSSLLPSLVQGGASIGAAFA